MNYRLLAPLLIGQLPVHQIIHPVINPWVKLYCKDQLYKQQRSEAGYWLRSGSARVK